MHHATGCESWSTNLQMESRHLVKLPTALSFWTWLWLWVDGLLTQITVWSRNWLLSAICVVWSWKTVIPSTGIQLNMQVLHMQSCLLVCMRVFKSTRRFSSNNSLCSKYCVSRQMLLLSIVLFLRSQNLLNAGVSGNGVAYHSQGLLLNFSCSLKLCYLLCSSRRQLLV